MRSRSSKAIGARFATLFRAVFAVTTCVGAVVIQTGCDGETERDANTVQIWAHQGQERENAAMRAIIDAFNQAHADKNVRAEITFFPDRNYNEKVTIAARTGTLPDILDIDGPYVGPWAADGLIVPLGDLVSAELRDDMLPSLIKQGTYNEQLYALGAFESALVLYYNRDIIEKAGIAPPSNIEDAWTWDEFVAALEKVKPYAPRPVTLHTNEESAEWYTYAFAPLVWSNGGRLIDTQSHQATGVLNSARNVAALEKWQDLFARGLAEPSQIDPNPFAKQEAAFDWTGHWMLPSFQEAEGLRFGVTPIPTMGDEAVVPSGSWCWGISRDCDRREKAWQVIEWFLDPENGIKPIVDANSAVPGRKSAFALFPEYDEMPRKLFREQLLQAAHPRPRTPVYLALTREFGQALQEIANGAAVSERLGAAADAVQTALERRQR